MTSPHFPFPSFPSLFPKGGENREILKWKRSPHPQEIKIGKREVRERSHNLYLLLSCSTGPRLGNIGPTRKQESNARLIHSRWWVLPCFGGSIVRKWEPTAYLFFSLGRLAGNQGWKKDRLAARIMKENSCQRSHTWTHPWLLLLAVDKFLSLNQ